MIIMTLKDRSGLSCGETGWGARSFKFEEGAGFGFRTERHCWLLRTVEPIALTSNRHHVLITGLRDQRCSPNRSPAPKNLQLAVFAHILFLSKFERLVLNCIFTVFKILLLKSFYLIPSNLISRRVF